MGLHTWCYEKIDLNTLKLSEMKEEIEKHFIEIINILKEEIENEEDKEELKILKNDLKFYLNVLLNFDKLNKKRKILKLYSEISSDLLYYKNDMFRIEPSEDYKEENFVLKNIDDVFNVFKTNVTYGKRYYSEDLNTFIEEGINIELIKEFWSIYKNGIIIFG